MNLINADTKVKITNVAARVSDFAEIIDADNFNMRTEANLLRDIAILRLVEARIGNALLCTLQSELATD